MKISFQLEEGENALSVSAQKRPQLENGAMGLHLVMGMACVQFNMTCLCRFFSYPSHPATDSASCERL